MKTKKRQPSRVSERDVQQEIDNFLRALSSYPDRFAREPYLSFQQHLSRVVATTHSLGTHADEARRRSG
jgi:hypothetical protein